MVRYSLISGVFIKNIGENLILQIFRTPGKTETIIIFQRTIKIL